MTTSYDLRDLAGDDGATAVVDGERTVAYGDLDRTVNRVANGLLAFGLAHQDRVAFLGKNSLACVEVMLGAARAGLVPTILNWRLHPSELAYVLGDSGATVVFVADEFVDALPAVEHVIVVDGPRASYGPWRDAHDVGTPAVAVAPDDVAAQLYTSGTTGRPKGAMLTYAGFAATIPDMGDIWELTDRSVMLSVLPMFHIAGVGTALGTLSRGACLVIDNDARPAATFAAVERHGVTNLVLASVMLQGLVSAPDGDGRDRSTLRTISYGAAPITQQVLEDAVARFGCRFVQPYGLTETTGVVTILDADDHAVGPHDEARIERLRSCGRARPGVELRVVDPNDGADLPPGEVGELWVRTPRLMKGYWNRPEATAEVLDQEGWFRTGDLGTVDDDGYLFLHDRLKDMIVSGGENVYPAEVEDALQWHPAVAEVAVIGIPHERWGETPRAVVVLAVGQEVSEDELLQFARARLAHYKCPTSVEFTESLPRNPTGKVLRRTLREAHWAGRDRLIN